MSLSDAFSLRDAFVDVAGSEECRDDAETTTVLAGPGPVADASGRPTRNRTFRPCGCWVGEVYRDVPGTEAVNGVPCVTLVDGKLPGTTVKAWVKDAGLCDVHAGAFAVRALQSSGSIPEHGKKFLDEHADRLLREEARLDAKLALEARAGEDARPTRDGDFRALAVHASACPECGGPDDGCEIGQRLEQAAKADEESP